ncbi:MAG: PaaI family thioesterase [bacterium]
MSGHENASEFAIAMLSAIRPSIENQHPLFGKVDLDVTSVGRGTMSCTLTAIEAFSDGAVIHGGMFTILLDTILAYAVWTRMDNFKPIATINLKTDYLGHATPGDRIICNAHCQNIHDNVAFCTGNAVLADTKSPIANAAGTFMVGTKNISAKSRL